MKSLKLSYQFFIFIGLVAFLSFGSPAHANSKYSSVVIEADTGLVLHQRHADKVLHPASLTKMMTLVLTFEALDAGKIRLKDRIRISKHAASMVPSKLDLPVGSRIRVEDAIYALVTKSANDVAVALAEHLGRTESNFAKRMTNRARSIGMKNTTFRNASGLHHKRQVSTARDMAKLAQYILKRYPHYYSYFSTKQFTYRGKTYRNHNRLLGSYSGMDGFKTGYISASGFNLVASAKRNGQRIIGVVYGGRSSKTRNAHMRKLLDRGFDRVKTLRIAKAYRAPVPERKPLPVRAVASSVQADPSRSGFTSLASLNTRTKVEVPGARKRPSWAELNTQALQKQYFSEMIGEGDFDPAVSKRLETGLLAVAVHKGDYVPNPQPASPLETTVRNAGHALISRMARNPRAKIDPASIEPRAGNIAGANLASQAHWQVQIGAYNSRVATDNALRAAKSKLPRSLSHATPVAVPLQTSDGVLFRARLSGFDQKQADQACKIFKDCITVAPQSY